MTTRSSWSEPEIDLREEDPFAGPIEQLGIRVDLTDSDELEYRLVDSLRREGALEDEGVTCVIKGKADTSCHACPISEAEDTTPLSSLCRVGLQQERLCTQLAVNTLGADD